MKFALALVAAGLVAAQDFSGVPECALPCLADAIPKVGCALTDTACQCTTEKQEALVPVVAPCLLSACSSEDLGKAQAAAAEACRKFLATAGAGSSAQASATGPAASVASSAAATPSASAPVVTSVPSNGTASATSTLSGSLTPSATGAGASATATTPATGAAPQGVAAVGGVAVAALFGIAATL